MREVCEKLDGPDGTWIGIAIIVMAFLIVEIVVIKNDRGMRK
jgi:hypothetical protein